MSSPRFRPALLHPRYWLTWLGFLLWYLLALLPYTVQLVLGRLLGKLLYRAAGRRRQIARANLDLCFPDWTPERREQVTREIIESIGIAFFETGMAWFWPKWRLQRLYTVEGLEYLTAAREGGVGVVLMAFHFTHIDIGAKLLGLSFSIDGTYRPHNNPVYDYIQRNGRERHSMQGQAIPRDDVRAMVKALRNGRAIWYAPDQDYGAKHSIFVPLFGIQAATVTATSQLARLGKAQVIAFTQTRRADGKGYRLKIYPPLENFPTSDEVADTLRINQFVEARILEQPEQYLWVHRRFKSRPEGEPDLYEQAGVRRKQR